MELVMDTLLGFLVQDVARVGWPSASRRLVLELPIASMNSGKNDGVAAIIEIAHRFVYRDLDGPFHRFVPSLSISN